MNLTHSFYRVYQSVYKVAMGALDWTPPELLQGAGAIKKLPEENLQGVFLWD